MSRVRNGIILFILKIQSTLAVNLVDIFVWQVYQIPVQETTYDKTFDILMNL